MTCVKVLVEKSHRSPEGGDRLARFFIAGKMRNNEHLSPGGPEEDTAPTRRNQHTQAAAPPPPRTRPRAALSRARPQAAPPAPAARASAPRCSTSLGLGRGRGSRSRGGGGCAIDVSEGGCASGVDGRGPFFSSTPHAEVECVSEVECANEGAVELRDANEDELGDANEVELGDASEVELGDGTRGAFFSSPPQAAGRAVRTPPRSRAAPRAYAASLRPGPRPSRCRCPRYIHEWWACTRVCAGALVPRSVGVDVGLRASICRSIQTPSKVSAAESCRWAGDGRGSGDDGGGTALRDKRQGAGRPACDGPRDDGDVRLLRLPARSWGEFRRRRADVEHHCAVEDDGIRCGGRAPGGGGGLGEEELEGSACIPENVQGQELRDAPGNLSVILSDTPAVEPEFMTATVRLFSLVTSKSVVSKCVMVSTDGGI
ncbi:hypothetical protein C8J57DRAFT_1675285 [Mycena rebaudengoi]|nr:hypothetical protein C8J57DRAFT_1675285 [Mycena rebaudengoi]